MSEYPWRIAIVAPVAELENIEAISAKPWSIYFFIVEFYEV